MPQIALHTVLLREHGVHDWRIWRSGRDVFHLVDVEDYQLDGQLDETTGE